MRLIGYPVVEDILYPLRVLHGDIHGWQVMKRFQYLCRHKKKKKKVVATAFHGKTYGDNPRYIVEKIYELLPETEIVWLCEKACEEVPSFIRTVNNKDQRAVTQELSSASVIIGNSRCFINYPKQIDQLHIETWHGGLGFKKIGMDAVSRSRRVSKRLNRAYDFYLSNSDHLTMVLRTAFQYDGLVWKSGYPIEDALFIDNGERQLFRECYHLPEDTRILLYVPTFRSRYQWRAKLNVAHVVEAMQKRFGGKWVMMVHWHPSMRQEDRFMADVVDVTNCSDMQSLVKAADACITDYSSSIFQAVQCHIPCFVYADDYEAYNMDRGLYYPLDEQPFPYALTEAELIDNILHYDAALWDEKWKQYQVRMGHIVTGHSAEDVAKVCVDFLNGKPKSDIMKEIPFETRF